MELLFSPLCGGFHQSIGECDVIMAVIHTVEHQNEVSAVFRAPQCMQLVVICLLIRDDVIPTVTVCSEA